MSRGQPGASAVIIIRTIISAVTKICTGVWQDNIEPLFFFFFGCMRVCFVRSMGLNRGLCIVIYHRASAFNTTLTGSKSGLGRFPKERIHRYKSLVLHTHSSPPSQRWMLMCFRSTFITSNKVENAKSRRLFEAEMLITVFLGLRIAQALVWNTDSQVTVKMSFEKVLAGVYYVPTDGNWTEDKERVAWSSYFPKLFVRRKYCPGRGDRLLNQHNPKGWKCLNKG